MTKLDEIVAGAGQAIGVRRIYGEPYEKNGVTIIPAARVMGGAGSGSSETSADATGEGQAGRTPAGSGAGFGLSGRPVGAIVIRGDEVKWLPAIDVNRAVFGFQLMMIVLFLAVRSIMKSHDKALIEAAKHSR